MPPNAGPPPHIHYAEDETFVMLDGALTFRVGEATHAATAGTVLYIPRGVAHGFTNVGDAPARMIFIYTPQGMERMFAEIGTPGQRDVAGPPLGEADVAAMVSVAAKYNYEILPAPAASGDDPPGVK